VIKVPRARKGQPAQPVGAPVTTGNVTYNDGGQHKKGSHQRGLSMFQDNDVLNTIINNGEMPQQQQQSSAGNDGLCGLSIDTSM